MASVSRPGNAFSDTARAELINDLMNLELNVDFFHVTSEDFENVIDAVTQLSGAVNKQQPIKGSMKMPSVKISTDSTAAQPLMSESEKSDLRLLRLLGNRTT